MDTKIKKARIYRAVSKITKPIADSTHTISKIAFYRQHHVSCKNDCSMCSHCIIGKGVTFFAEVKVARCV